jgi:threonine dehydrogenase-like Zn-dependent dehydrogenase
MLAVAVVQPDQIEVVEVPEPQPGPYEAKIRTEAACICNMTDRKVVEGHFPGLTHYPLLLGHETVGIVEAVGDKVRTFKVGDRVVGGLVLQSPDPAYGSGWGGFSGYTLAGDHQAMTADGVADNAHGWYEVHEIMRVVPPDIGVEDAVMLCTWREVYGAFGDFHLQPGDNLVIYGDGPVGLSFVKFGRLLGMGDIYLIGRHTEKLEKAVALGATGAYLADSPEAARLVDIHGDKFDGIIDAVGRQDIVNAALGMVKMNGSIGVYGVIGASSVTLDISKAPFNFNLFMHQWPTRFREYAAQEPLLDWVRAGQLSYREFVSVEFPITQAAEAFAHSKIHKPIKTLFRYT